MWADLTTDRDSTQIAALEEAFVLPATDGSPRRIAPEPEVIPDTPGINVGGLMAAMATGVVR